MKAQSSQHIAAFIRSHLAVQPTAGISIGITDKEKTLLSWSYGFSNLEAQLPLTPAHLFQIGSIGKSFTSLILMQLYEQGLFDPQAPVREYLPWLEFQNSGAVITGHHLLTHTAGLITGTDEAITAFGEAWALRDIPVLPPAGRFHYSNTGYKILGLVVEKLTGKDYPTVVRERILEPLGMESTEPHITNLNHGRHAQGYTPFPLDRTIRRPFDDKTRLTPATWLETDTADGCISSTPGDMAIYIRTLMNQFSPLIQPETFDLMTSPKVSTMEDERAPQYAYGLEIEDPGEAQWIGHGGGMVGYTSQLLCSPEAGIGVIVLMNGPGGAGTVARFALSAVLAEAAGKTLPEIPEPADYFAISEDQGFAGKYHGRKRSILIEKRGSGLGISGLQPALAQRAPDILHLDHPDWNAFFMHMRRSDDGEVEALVYGGEVYYREEMPPNEADVPSAWHAYPGEYIAHNAWYPGFHVVLREGELYLMHYFEGEARLKEIESGLFRVGEEASPETIRFEVIVGGSARRAVFSGAHYHRKTVKS